MRPAPVLLLLACSLQGASPEVARHIDSAWFRETLASETAHWRDAAFRPEGFFAVSLDREWHPAGNQVATLVTQSRQIFVMGAGYELTRDPAYLNAMKKGADFLLARFPDKENGLLVYSVDPEGAVVDPNKDCYGLAFAIFGLSHAARVTGDKRYANAALEIWSELKTRLRYESGFFKPKTDRGYTRVIGQNTQNPMMHLFEALLALYDATGSREIFREAEAHADAIFGRLFQDREGRLPEIYDADWKPAPPEKGGYFELGHQFEWAYLLSRAVEKGFPKRYLATAERLLDYGVKVAYDEEEGGIFSRGDYEGRAVRGPKGWWEQCESLRAMMHWAATRGRADLWPAFDKSLAFARKNIIDAEYGGWFYSYDPKVAVRTRTNKGTVWQVGYHVSGMYQEALRLAK
jgi:mannose/cellobiose epimerase-like protein (N-acyl-D-glucosamine 2-epimerase family)